MISNKPNGMIASRLYYDVHFNYGSERMKIEKL